MKTKPGRPTIPISERKCTFTVRLKPDVLRILQIKANLARLGRGDYLAQLIINGSVATAQHEKA